MQATVLQVILLMAYLLFMQLDGMNTQVFIYGYTLTGGFVTGLIFGNPLLGLEIGGTLQLMSLGIGAYGGASVPNYTAGGIIGTATAIMSGQDLAYGLSIAVPVSLLMMQVDILIRTVTVAFIHKAESYVDTLETKKMYRWILMGFIPWAMGSLPIILVIVAGTGLIDSVLGILPDWFMGGMQIAGGILPAVGISILLKYMNIKKYFGYLIAGFALMTYFGIPMVGVALFGLAAGLISYQNDKGAVVTVSSGQSTQSGKVGDDEDEI